MPTVTFYKTNMNRSNRAYDEAALNRILTSASSLQVDVGKQIIPETPFAMTYDGDSGQDILLSGYDYISYEYGDKTWYAFIDDIQPLATAIGQVFVQHTTDKWAMCLVYFIDTLKLNGSLERAHVNDLVYVDDMDWRIDLSNTLSSAEVNFNSTLCKQIRPEMPKYIDIEDREVRWLYIYIANPAEIWQDSPPPSTNQYWVIGAVDDNIADGSGYPVFGLLLVYPLVGNNIHMIYDYVSSDDPPYTMEMFSIDDLTSSAITAMAISSIPPCSYKDNPTGVTEDTYGNIYPDWNSPAFDRFHYAKTSDYISDDTGLPTYLNWFTRIWGMGGLYPTINHSDIITVDDANYQNYINKIPKLKSVVYNPVYIGNYQLPCSGGDSSVELTGYTGITPNLQSVYHYMNGNSFLEGKNCYVVSENSGVYASDIVLDYWTRLNAIQSTIAANKSIFNSIMGVTKSAFGVVSSGVQSLTNTGVAMLTGNVAGGLKSLTSGALNSVSSKLDLASSIGNAYYDIQSANNVKEMAEQQYAAGNTNAGNTYGYEAGYIDPPEENIIQYQITVEYDIIANNLHRYGYNTPLLIDEVYANHRRAFFNFFKGVDVTVSGIIQSWAEDIAQMFNSGVTLWQCRYSSAAGQYFKVLDYNCANYQLAVWEEVGG